MSKNLIIYYSRKGENYVNGRIEKLSKGNTEICAEFIQKAVGGELFEVETESEYSADYHTCTEEARAEFDSNSRPKLKSCLNSIAEYSRELYLSIANKLGVFLLSQLPDPPNRALLFHKIISPVN